MRSDDWQKYVDDKGDFEFPKYLFKTISDLMKTSLDMGTLVCTDQAKLRAYKERTKQVFKSKWADIASALEFFDIIEPCVCRNDEFCTLCGGSRYILSESMTPDEVREVGLVFSADAKIDIAEKLHKGMIKALDEVRSLDKLTVSAARE